LACTTALAVSARAEEPFVGFLDADTAPVVTLSRFGGAPARILDADAASGRLAAVIELRPGARLRTGGDRERAEEFFVLDGALQLGRAALARHDYAFLPADIVRPLTSTATGARVLWFADPAPADPAVRADLARVGLYVTRAAGAQWTAGTVALAAGVDLRLRIRHLRKDPWSGARTWLVGVDPGQAIPWERHGVIEEGFLVEGRYVLVECLPGGERRGTYAPGGYFRRPGGIVHSGPKSGPLEPSVWLLRTPAALDVTFSDTCER
jgi:hypothetical protein